jgi:hypothetical protein
MRTQLALLGLLALALPLLAGTGERRVVAPCELTTANAIITGKISKTEGHEYTVRVVNNSTRTIAMPSSPVFGWRVDTLHKREWHLKAEGGPVRRISATDDHIVAIGHPANLALVEITPGGSRDYDIFLPEAEPALQSEGQRTTLKLTILWAAPSDPSQGNPALPPCGLAPEWVVSRQKLVPQK